MDFNQVRYFLALAETMNFTRAAEKSFVTQPALTQAIKRLEHELGGDLVVRDGRNMVLTELGHNLRRHFEQIDQTRQLVKKTAKAVIDGEVAELNLGLMCTIGPKVLVGMLSAFQKKHPHVSVVLHDVAPDAISELLKTGALDGVFSARHGAAANESASELAYLDLFDEPLVLAMPNDHPLTATDEVPLNDIVGHDYIDRLHCEFRQEVIDIYQAKGLELNVVFRSQREDWIQSLVCDGLGVSCIPQFSLLRPELTHRPITAPQMKRTVTLLTRHDGNSVISPAMQVLMTHAKNWDWTQIQ